MSKSSNPAVWAGIEPPDGLELAWKAVHPGGRTRGTFQWPFKGVVQVPAGKVIKSNSGPCPQAEGDGLCLAKTWDGAASGGITAITGLAITFDRKHVLGEDENKLRVQKCKVVGVLDLHRLLREHGSGAYLPRASLSGASLSWADLSGANLSGADLYRANLSGANLSGADLYRANLSWASLSWADLSGANFYGAYLFGADLSGADLRWAVLSAANLSGAKLSGADLSGALHVPESVKGAA